MICAHSPQAKGRVERNNQTQQDRLVKELRLAGINTIQQANLFLYSSYWDKHNRKFAKEAKSTKDAHRTLLLQHDLDNILCHKEERTLSKNLEIQYKNVIYQIDLKQSSRVLQHAKVTVIERLDGEVRIEYKGKYLPFKIHTFQECVGKEVNSKELDQFLKEKKPRTVRPDHPWKQEGRAEAKKREFQHI